MKSSFLKRQTEIAAAKAMFKMLEGHVIKAIPFDKHNPVKWGIVLPRDVHIAMTEEITAEKLKNPAYMKLNLENVYAIWASSREQAIKMYEETPAEKFHHGVVTGLNPGDYEFQFMDDDDAEDA